MIPEPGFRFVVWVRDLRQWFPPSDHTATRVTYYEVTRVTPKRVYFRSSIDGPGWRRYMPRDRWDDLVARRHLLDIGTSIP